MGAPARFPHSEKGRGVSSQAAGACGGETAPGRGRRGPPGGGSLSDH